MITSAIRRSVPQQAASNPVARLGGTRGPGDAQPISTPRPSSSRRSRDRGPGRRPDRRRGPDRLRLRRDVLRAHAAAGRAAGARPPQVSAVHRIASERRVALTPRAMGSGLSGGAVPLGGSIVLGVARMDRILEIDAVDRVAVVQAGVINARLQAEVERLGLFYPPDPSSLKQSAIGGNVAENAGGARCLKYGVTGDYVLALEVVLPDGTVIRTGGRTVKNVTGLRSAPAVHRRRRDARHDHRDHAAAALEAEVRARRDGDVRPHRRRGRSGDGGDGERACCRRRSSCSTTSRCAASKRTHPIGLPLDADAILIFGVDGNHESVLADDLAAIERIAREHGARDVNVARSDASRERLWAARRSISPALARRRPNKLGEDVCVPPRAIAALVRARARDRGGVRAGDPAVRPHRRRQSAPEHPVRQARPRRDDARRRPPRARSSRPRSSWAARSRASTASAC